MSQLYLSDSVTNSTNLNGARDVEIITIDGRSFVYTASVYADTINISELFADGTLAQVGTVQRVSGDGLDGTTGLASTVVGGTNYLYVAAEYSDAITVFEVGTDGLLTSVQTIFDSDNALYEIDRPLGELTIATAGGNQFLIAHGNYDNGISVFQIGSNGQLTNTTNVDDASDTNYTLDGVYDTAFAEHMGTSFVFASGYDENGVSVFELSSTGQLTFRSSITDAGDLELYRAYGLETAVVGGVLYLYVAGYSDAGVSVFSVDATGTLTNLFNYTDDANLALYGALDVETFEFDGTQYLVVTGEYDDGFSVFSIGADGSLTAAGSVFDSDDPSYLLNDVQHIDFVEIDGQGMFVVSSEYEDAISVFQVSPDDIMVNGTPDDDLIVATGRDESIDGLEGDDVILGNGGNDSIDAGEGDDLASGGDGDDRIFGDGDLTQTASDVVTVSETGLDLALSVTLPDSSDGSTIEISGIVNRVPGDSSDYNIVYVIDTSGSMGDPFSGNETVGDLNGDGSSNTLIDGTIEAFQSLNDSLVAAGFASSDVSIVRFAGDASTVFEGSALSGVNDALATLDSSGGTNFEIALQEAISALQGMGTGQNIVYFISDGADGGGIYTDEVATLIDPAGLNATIKALGLGLSANLDQLDFVDDNVDNDSSIQVLEPSTLTGGLASSPVNATEVDRLEIYVNGTLVRTVDGSTFVSTPLGLQYNATIDGLSTSAGDTIEAVLVASDTDATEVSVTLEVPNEDLEIGNDTLIGGEGNDMLDGDGGNDTLLGETGSDLLIGGAGNDFLDGGSGDDRLFGDSGNDTLIGGAGADILTGGVGDDSYYVDGKDLVDEGTGGSSDFDTIFTATTTDLTNLRSNFLGTFEGIQLIGDIDSTARGDNGANILGGNEGDNLLVGRDGDDTMSGGNGDDVMAGGDDNDDMSGDAGEDTLYGNDGNDTLDGGEGNDDLFGGNGSDRLYGQDGNDSMEGGAGADTLAGGDGNDRVYGEGNHDYLYGNDGDDTIIGATGNDYISGGNGNDVISGQEHNDTVRGGNGDDRIYGGEGEDLLSGNDGNDEIYGGILNDRIFGGSGADTLMGEGGADEIGGGNDNDRIDGGGNHDVLGGDDGNDTIFGSTGDDTIDGDDGDDVLSGQDDEDLVRGGDGNDRMYGGLDNDVLSGNTGNDEMHGGSGNDRLFGGTGDDTLEGDGGTDFLSGGSGADIFVFNDVDDSPHGTSRDTISDFTAGVDQIDLSGFAGTLSFVTAFTGSAGQVRYNDAIGRLYIDLDGDSASDVSIDLTGAPSIDAGDLIL